MQKTALEINKKNRKIRIVNAAIQVITRDKSVNMNLEEVVSLAGTSKSAIYELFKNKEGLLVEICKSVLYDSNTLLQADLSESDSLREDLIRHIDTFLSASHSDEYSSVMRLIYAKISQSKLIAESYFQFAVQAAVNNLENYLISRVSEGRLHIEDCCVAAKQLIGGIVWFEQSQVLCHGAQSLSQGEMRAEGIVMIDNFLLAHRVEEA